MKTISPSIKILYLKNLATSADQILHLLKNANHKYDIKVIDSKTEYKKALNTFVPEIIISDYNLSSFTSVNALNTLKQLQLTIPFILISKKADKDIPRSMMEQGAYDYVKEDDLQRLPYTILNVLENNKIKDKEHEGKFYSSFENTIDGITFAELEHTKISNDLIQHYKKIEQFNYIISHNLRSPIANILGLANVLKSNLSDSERDKIQQFLFTAVEQLDQIVKDLNTILQINSELTENKNVVDFPTLVSDIKSSIQNLIEKENVQIVTDFTDVPEGTFIKSYIQSIFYNLITNSIKYRQLSKQPIIKIKSKLYKNKIRISFKDNGTGIDLNQHGDKIFGLYKCFHPHIEGKGLGIFMIKTQIEVLGGNINVKIKVNIGAEFLIELPM